MITERDMTLTSKKGVRGDRGGGKRGEKSSKYWTHPIVVGKGAAQPKRRAWGNEKKKMEVHRKNKNV